MKAISLKMHDDVYDEMMSYAQVKNKSLTGMVRAIVKQGLFDSLQADKSDLERFTKMLADPETYQLSNKEKVDYETRVALLKVSTERFADLWADLASEIYGEEN